MIRDILIVAVAVFGACSAVAAPHALIVCGAGGTEEYTARFTDWGERLETWLVDTARWPAEHVQRLNEDAAEVKSILGAVSGLAGAGTEEPFYVFLIGHGSAQANEASLLLQGDDLAARDLADALAQYPDRSIVVVNAASCSAGFINSLSGSRRIVVSSTKSVRERQATEFMEHLLTALEEGNADVDRDGRIDLLEAARQASARTAAWFEREGYVRTENALIDDNGDGLGTRLDGESLAEGIADGHTAEALYLLDQRFPPGAPEALIAAYREAIAGVEALIAMKPDIPDDTLYYGELEQRLVRAARLRRAIEQAGDPDS